MWNKSDGPGPSERLDSTQHKEAGTWLEDFLASRPLLLKVVGRLARPEDIEDIVQETFIRSYVASRRKKISNPGAFMLTTARNIALNVIKRADRKGHLPLDELYDDDLAQYADDVVQRHQADEMFRYFCRAVARLPVDCRRVFILQKVYGFTQNEIAARLGISPRTVEKHVAKGMVMTGSYLVAKGYWDESEFGPLADSKDEEASCP
ncbi:MAG TPA: RNA polymerase sigma factor [Hyphomicrobiales bacterium]|nr:RNA polymerase sigma factor [Hyphomicrobiales bacterium]